MFFAPHPLYKCNLTMCFCLSSSEGYHSEWQLSIANLFFIVNLPFFVVNLQFFDAVGCPCLLEGVDKLQKNAYPFQNSPWKKDKFTSKFAKSTKLWLRMIILTQTQTPLSGTSPPLLWHNSNTSTKNHSIQFKN